MTMHVNRRLEALTHRARLSADNRRQRCSLLLIGWVAHRARSVRRMALGTNSPDVLATRDLTLLINRADRLCAKPHPLRNHTNREHDNHTGNCGKAAQIVR